MAADPSAYAALGLEPGANAEAIEQAYKTLIKRFHPDRAGGDARRAAEINRAYRELRAASGYKDALEFDTDRGFEGGRGVRAAVFMLAGAGLLALLLVAGPIVLTASSSRPPAPSTETSPAAGAIDQPLAAESISEGIREAVRLSRSSDEIALADFSRDCHRRLRAEPTVARLDRCAAFDDAVVQLQDRDPLRDRGPFSELAVTGRKMSGATQLSNDYLAIDSRLDQVRLQVELALAPPPPPAGAATAKDD